MNAAVDTQLNNPASPRSRPADWLWRPWYAKLWWAAIPVWWSGMALSSKLDALASFYDSAAAGFLNLLFFPMTALMVLGVGYVRHWLTSLPNAGDGAPLSKDAAARVADLWEQHERGMEDLHATTDIHDPRSGTLYTGNSISPNNGARISVF